MENERGQYRLKLIGPNGESVCQKKLIFEFIFKTHIYKNKVEMITDQNGFIHLGDLNEC